MLAKTSAPTAQETDDSVTTTATPTGRQHSHYEHHNHDYEASGRYRHYPDNGSVAWGVLLIFGGLLLLLTSIGTVSWNVWGALGHFWSALLVLIGIHIMMGDSRQARYIIFPLAVLIIGSSFLTAIYRSDPNSTRSWVRPLRSYIQTIDRQVSK